MESNEHPRAQRFVSSVLARCGQDNGFAARLRRADNPDTEYYALGDLCNLGINVENDFERLPFALVGAALCRHSPPRDGGMNLGEALRACFEEEKQGATRLRRLLACDRQDELCRVLRPVLSLVAARASDRGVSLCYAGLLDDLLDFRSDFRQQRIKLQWAQGYYRNKAKEETPEGEVEES